MRKVASLVGVAVAATTVALTPASAATTPTLGLKIPAHAHAHKATPISWSAANARGDKVVLQGFDSGHWNTFETVHGSSGKTTIPAEPIGIYDIRIAAFDRAGQLVTAVGRKLHVFGLVKWATLFKNHTNPGTYGGFHYVLEFFSNQIDYAALAVKHSDCDAVHIRYIPGIDGSRSQSVTNPSEGTVKLSRNRESTITRRTAPQRLAGLNASVPLHRAWTIHLSEPGTGGRILTWYFNGTADCDQLQLSSYSLNQS